MLRLRCCYDVVRTKTRRAVQEFTGSHTFKEQRQVSFQNKATDSNEASFSAPTSRDCQVLQISDAKCFSLTLD